jgi:hydrogenase expression/formation protein HypC
MCLAIPILVEALLPDDLARVTLGGVSKVVSVALLEDVQVGDYLLIHAGYALASLDPDEAGETLALMRQAAVPSIPDDEERVA